MKDTLLSSVLVAVIVSGLVFGNIFHLGTVTVSASVAPTRAPTTIADTNSVYSLEFIHQTVVRLSNGTLCATFSTNLLGTVNNAAVTLFQAMTMVSHGATPLRFLTAPEWKAGFAVKASMAA